jgi:flagellar hook assembly protein FlgD
VVNNTVVPVADVPAAAVPALAFEPVVPNPSASDSRLAFALAAEGDASLAIFDVQGREVRSVARGRLSAGRHEFVWDGRDGTGRPVTAGIYFAVAQVGGARSIQRVARTR